MLFSDVTAVIPTYNRLEMLGEAVESVRRQSLPPRQLIVVDDGSTDGTWDWLQSQKGLIALRQDNRGPAAARNLGAAAAETEYLAFLDSDDLWLPPKLETQTAFLEENPECRFCQTEEIWYRNGARVNPMKKHAKPSGQVFEACLSRCLISPSGVMFRREFFVELGGFDESFEVCEDYELWLRASLASPFRTLEEPLVLKRGGHLDQLSRAHWGMDRFRVEALEKLLRQETLAPHQRAKVIEELARKLEILSNGFQKRRPGQIDPYRERLRSLALD
ncbi:MAG TPA: glycosyltransferase family A protein [bacterium]|nr:glycosyltransferase family A protein [bacterium]